MDRRTEQDRADEAATVRCYRRLADVQGVDVALQEAAALIGKLQRHVRALNAARTGRA